MFDIRQNIYAFIIKDFRNTNVRSMELYEVTLLERMLLLILSCLKVL